MNLDEEVTREELLKLYQDIISHLDYLQNNILEEEVDTNETTII